MPEWLEKLLHAAFHFFVEKPLHEWFDGSMYRHPDLRNLLLGIFVLILLVVYLVHRSQRRQRQKKMSGNSVKDRSAQRKS